MLQSPSQNGKQREYRFQHFLKDSRNLKRNLHNFHFPTRPKCSAESIAVEGAEETYAPQRLGAFWLLLLCRNQRVRTVNGGPFPLASIHNSAPNEEIAVSEIQEVVIQQRNKMTYLTDEQSPYEQFKIQYK
ncbi:Hypothetical_protein [Hexamita inflata]|uniref:Hypothetical_protein n=1 Tax=Hexamita inflata TaxID=28002 RepID=A0AA86QZK1_9EUKA|nr:Hypothetical protein HINF_LOCUS56601 [Hexamita inflata]